MGHPVQSLGLFFAAGAAAKVVGHDTAKGCAQRPQHHQHGFRPARGRQAMRQHVEQHPEIPDSNTACQDLGGPVFGLDFPVAGAVAVLAGNPLQINVQLAHLQGKVVFRLFQRQQLLRRGLGGSLEQLLLRPVWLAQEGLRDCLGGHASQRTANRAGDAWRHRADQIEKLLHLISPA